MNEADIKLLEAEAYAASAAHSVAMAQAIIRIQHDLSVLLEKVTRIEDTMTLPSQRWDDREELDDGEFPF
jgi:hypothetical protein